MIKDKSTEKKSEKPSTEKSTEGLTVKKDEDFSPPC